MANRSDFAWAPADVPESGWKLNISTRDFAIRAAMALGPKGYRGNQADIPEADLPAVKAKVRAALKRFGVPNDSEVWQHVKASETAAFMDPTPTDLATPTSSRLTFFNRLHGLLRDHFKTPKADPDTEDTAEAPERPGEQPDAEDKAEGAEPVLTKSQYAAHVNSARAHAGGKAKAAARKASEPVSLVELCEKVEDGQLGWRLFTELQAFADVPTWVNVLPPPGQWEHKSYGAIDMTPDRIARFLDNHQKRVYQQHIPVDIEHQTKLSGAAAYYGEGRINPNGSLDIELKWTDRGNKLVNKDGFKYFSPEWFDTWTDPATGITHHDVLVGGAITTRPFFKEKSLRPLVASERGLEAADDLPEAGSADPVLIFHALQPVLAEPPAILAAKTEETPVAEPQVTTPMAATEPPPHADSKTFSELVARIEALEVEKTTLKQASEDAVKQATDRVQALERAARVRQFTDLVTGRGGDSDGAPWFGSPEENVSRLERFAEAFGTDTEAFQAELQRERAIAAQLKDSRLFSQFSHGQTAPGGSSPMAQIEAGGERLRQQRNDSTYTKEMAETDFLQTPEGRRLHRAFDESRGV